LFIPLSFILKMTNNIRDIRPLDLAPVLDLKRVHIWRSQRFNYENSRGL